VINDNEVQIHPIPFDGVVELEKKHGGVLPLPVRVVSKGVFVSVWVVNRHALKVLKKEGAVISIVINTNVEGHPEISLRAQVATLMKDN